MSHPYGYASPYGPAHPQHMAPPPYPVPPGYPPHLMARPLPPPYMPGMRPALPLSRAPGAPPPLGLPRGLPALQGQLKPPEESPMKVFVGKLPPDVPDQFIRKLLDECGKIDEWNRAIDPNTNRPKNFGFCTYNLPTGARRALKLLNGFKVDYQEMLIKVGKKEQEALEKMELPEENEKDEEAAKRIVSLIRERNLGVGKKRKSLDDNGQRGEENGDGEEEEEEEEEEDEGMRDAEHVEERKKDPNIMSQIEKFRQAQAKKDRKREEDRVREMKRRVEEQARQERMKADKEEREAKEQARREEALATVQARKRSPSSDASDSDNNASRRRPRSSSASQEDGRRDRKSRRREYGEEDAAASADRLVSEALQDRPRGSRAREDSPAHATLTMELCGENAGGSQRKLGMSFASKSKVSKSGRAANSNVSSGFFGGEEEDDKGKARVLIPLDYDEDQKHRSRPSNSSQGVAQQQPQQADGNTAGSKASKNPGISLNDRQKQLVSQIPRDADALFSYPIDWTSVERYDLIRGKTRDWVTKKIKDLLGEEERTLIDFICGKLSGRCSPRELLNELKLVLEDDADVFVQKLWRILIYFIIERRDN